MGVVNTEELWRVCIVVGLVINIFIYIVGDWVVVLGFVFVICPQIAKIERRLGFRISGLEFRVCPQITQIGRRCGW